MSAHSIFTNSFSFTISTVTADWQAFCGFLESIELRICRWCKFLLDSSQEFWIVSCLAHIIRDTQGLSPGDSGCVCVGGGGLEHVRVQRVQVALNDKTYSMMLL